MQARQLVPLLVCSFVQWVVTNGLLALLPVYAGQLGGDAASTGNLMAVAFFGLAVGTVGAGWLSDKFNKRRAFIVGASVVYGVCALLMGVVPRFWQLIPLALLTWLSAGIFTSMMLVLVGMFWTGRARATVFGMIGVIASLGALFGGAFSGVIVKLWGYTALFTLGGAAMLVVPVFALMLDDHVQGAPPSAEETPRAPRAVLGTTFYFVMLAAIFSAIPIFIASLGRPLLMDRLHFSPTEISGAVAVGGAASIPFPLVLGRLADRLGHFRLIAVCYSLIGAGMVMLVGASAVWQFWLSNVLLSIGGAGGIVGLILVGKLVPPEVLSIGLARYGASGWIGGIFGLVGAGYAIQQFGTATTFIIGIGVAGVAFVCVLFARWLRWLPR
jgi:MFS family permease